MLWVIGPVVSIPTMTMVLTGSPIKGGRKTNVEANVDSSIWSGWLRGSFCGSRVVEKGEIRHNLSDCKTWWYALWLGGDISCIRSDS